MESVVPLSEIDKQRQKLRERIAASQAQLELLDRLAESAVSVRSRESQVSTKRSANRSSSPGNRFPATTGLNNVIRQIVRESPGLKATEIVDKVVQKGVATKSANPKRAFASSVDILRRRGHLVRKYGKLYIAEAWKNGGGGSTITSD